MGHLRHEVSHDRRATGLTEENALLIDLLPSTFQGLPLHALIVHGTVVGLPLTAVALLLSAFSDRVRTRFGIVLPLAGIVCLVLVALTMGSGDQIKARVYNPQLGSKILRHQHAAGQLVPWAIALTVMCIAVHVLGRRGGRPAIRSVGAAALSSSSRSGIGRTSISGRAPLSIVVAVLAAVAAIGTAVQVSYVGHLGAEIVYNGYSQLPVQQNLPGGD